MPNEALLSGRIRMVNRNSTITVMVTVDGLQRLGKGLLVAICILTELTVIMQVLYQTHEQGRQRRQEPGPRHLRE